MLRLRHDLGLDDPLLVQYGRFLGHAVTGNFGESLRHKEPAMHLVCDHLWATLELALAAPFSTRAFAMSKRFSPLVGLSWCVLLALFIAAVFSPQVAPHNPVRERLLDRLLPPVWAQDGDWQYFLGTDHLGRDVVSRMIYGSRVSLVVGFAAMAVGSAPGHFSGGVGRLRRPAPG